jgi:putative integral membrane protein (TIGR02587 family)
VLGRIVYEAMPFAIGVSLARHFLTGQREQGGDSEQQRGQEQEQEQQRGQEQERKVSDTVIDLGATAVGAVFIAFNIAPTDEIPMLVTAIEPPWLIAIMLTSLVVSYMIVFEAGFADAKKRREQKGLFQRPLTETVVSYLVALVMSALMLFLFQNLHLADPWTVSLSHVIVLGLPAAVGGAAGRLAV